MKSKRIAEYLPSIFAASILASASGCGGPTGPESSRVDAVQTTNQGEKADVFDRQTAKDGVAQSTNEGKEAVVFDQATAKEKLKTALDSWSFGDDPSKFRDDHPDVSFLNTGYNIIPPVLMKYEINEGRRRDDPTGSGVLGYEFPVILTLQNENGTPVVKREVYSVRTRDNRKWAVSINLP